MSFKEIEPQIQNVVNQISLAAAIVTLSTWLIIGKLRPRLLNRVTLLFQILIAFIDILRHVSNYNNIFENDTVCALVGACINFSDHVYVAFNTLLAINAHLIFISRQRPKMTFYPLYVGAALAYIAILNVCYYDNGSYGRNRFGTCFFKKKDGVEVHKLYMVYLMEFPGVLYSGYVAFLIMFKFKERMSKLRIFRNVAYSNLEESGEPKKHIKALYWRVSMYPISCFITLFPFLIGNLITDTGETLPTWYIFVFRFCRRIPGTTNLFFMLYDPNFQLAFKELFLFIRIKLTNERLDRETYELPERSQPVQNQSGLTWFEQICGNDEWQIEFDDGYRMTVQSHIKYL